ncbi:MAG TPA: dihydroorotate dehydrogenase-like protein [Thermoanaerobaculia bacterium]|nr:dihydroorotate dehydrogenase-like protein [Thermoanaerobaculia bacterium]HQP85235.1 dihydroorotate dehydrogenase-like protein [Thermoanaerobaculia bacterium]
MDLSTTYLGLKLPHPIMPGASPMVDKIDLVKRMEDAGAAAIVMHSLFEEQLMREELATYHHIDVHADSFAEAMTYLPRPDEFNLGPDQYLEQLVRIKQSVDLPVIASLNGFTSGGWIRYAKLMQDAGANALELNVYYLATNADEGGDEVEQRTIDILKAVKQAVTIPVAIKLSPFFSSMASMARRLDEAGADGLVLFNRFYQPDIDVESLEVEPTLKLSDSSELNLRLRWLAVVSGRVRASLAVSGGVHTHLDAVKAVMTGAHAVQVVSAILQQGPDVLRRIREGLTQWLEEHEYDSLEQMRGSMNLLRCPDASMFERANYIRILQGYKV